MVCQRRIGSIVFMLCVVGAWIYQDVYSSAVVHACDSVHKKLTKELRRLPRQAKKIALNATKNFGKTHFIVGYPEKNASQGEAQNSEYVSHEVDSYAEPKREGPHGFIVQGKVSQAFFGPDDAIQKALLYLIDQEKKSLCVAIYMFTDNDVAQAIVRAYERGVKVELVVDGSCLQERYNKIRVLCDKKIPVYVYDMLKRSDNLQGLMHNKFIIFACNLLDKPLVWTGSYNFTRSAYQRNQENVIVTDEAALVAKYRRHFKRLKGRSIAYTLHGGQTALA